VYRILAAMASRLQPILSGGTGGYIPQAPTSALFFAADSQV
jgi:hypothetical protein